MGGLTLPMTGSAIVAGILIWCAYRAGDIVVAWFTRVNKHMDDCKTKEVSEALLAQEVVNTQHRVVEVERKLDRVDQAVNENHIEIMEQLLHMSHKGHA